MVWPFDQHCLVVLLLRDTGYLSPGLLFQGIEVGESPALEVLLDSWVQPKIVRRQIWRIWRVWEVGEMELVEELKCQEGCMTGGIVHMDEMSAIHSCIGSELDQSSMKSSQDILENMLIHGQGPAHELDMDHPLRVKKSYSHHLSSPESFLRFLWSLLIMPEPLPALFLGFRVV